MISHTMKIWERVIDRTLNGEISTGEKQFHAGQMVYRCHTCSMSVGETPADAEGTALGVHLSGEGSDMIGFHGKKYGGVSRSRVCLKSICE